MGCWICGSSESSENEGMDEGEKKWVRPGAKILETEEGPKEAWVMRESELCRCSKVVTDAEKVR